MPDGQVLIAHTVLTVHSTAISFVGVALTVLAGAVLLVWWVRTWRRSRRAPPPGALTGGRHPPGPDALATDLGRLRRRRHGRLPGHRAAAFRRPGLGLGPDAAGRRLQPGQHHAQHALRHRAGRRPVRHLHPRLRRSAGQQDRARGVRLHLRRRHRVRHRPRRHDGGRAGGRTVHHRRADCARYPRPPGPAAPCPARAPGGDRVPALVRDPDRRLRPLRVGSRAPQHPAQVRGRGLGAHRQQHRVHRHPGLVRLWAGHGASWRAWRRTGASSCCSASAPRSGWCSRAWRSSRACAGPTSASCAGTGIPATRRCGPSPVWAAGPSASWWPTRWRSSSSPCWPAASGPDPVSSYTYAYAFFQLPYGIIAVTVMSVVTPDLADRWSTGQLAAFLRRITGGLRAVLALIIPSAVGMLLLARPAVALLLGVGHSTPAETATTGAAVLWRCSPSASRASARTSTSCACCSRCSGPGSPSTSTSSRTHSTSSWPCCSSTRSACAASRLAVDLVHRGRAARARRLPPVVRPPGRA